MTGGTAQAGNTLFAMALPEPAHVEFGPWNPGIESPVPRHLRHLVTIFRQENAFGDYARAEELADFTGMRVEDLCVLRPQRLALHELLVRVTADLSVPDGTKIGDLGINFREIVSAIFRRCIEPNTSIVVATYEAARSAIARAIAVELAAILPESASRESVAPREPTSWWRGLLVRGRVSGADTTTPAERDPLQVVAGWEQKARLHGDEMQRAVCRSLARVVSTLISRHGQVWGNRELLSSLATDVACNDYAGTEIGNLIEPWLQAAVEELGYRFLPSQNAAVVLNTKGPSASGKSTLRPLQKKLAGEIGVDWADFALISPDIWRKQLLDYASLGPDYKYAGAFTGDEVQIIDLKLDRYMARKAQHGRIPHLLIDRFRFDSFAPDSNEAGSNLLTRFGNVVYLFFMITPPAMLVERAWNRGLEFGRYKAVDDTLAHSVEAYSGMPELFFTWAGRRDKCVNFEFLDNSVRQGERPRTVAFGDNDELNVLDIKGLIDAERYRRVNIDATAPQFLFTDRAALAPERNSTFLTKCVAAIRTINFAEQSTGRIYLSVVSGVPVWADREALDAAAAEPDTRAGIAAAAPAAFAADLRAVGSPRYLKSGANAKRMKTLGAWGGLN
jgi:hypothetical protein